VNAGSRKYLRPEEVARLRATSRARYLLAMERGGWVGVRDHVAVELLVLSGVRVSGAASLTVRDLELDTRPPALNVTLKGGGRGRIVIPRELRDLLRQWLDHRRRRGEDVTGASPLVPSSRGGAITRSGLHRVWKGALQRAGLPETFGTHAARHSFATETYRRTRDLRLVQEQLGHRSPTTTAIYAAVLDEDKAAAAESIFTEDGEHATEE
jgi:integrase/recombinase XerD